MDKEELQEEKKLLDAFPSIDDDVEFDNGRFTDRQLERFALVRDLRRKTATVAEVWVSVS